MDPDFPNLWQSQPTTKATMSMEEFRRRVGQAKRRAARKHFIVLSIALANLAGAIGNALFSFSPYRSVVVWAVALQFLAWVIWCWYLPKDWLVLRSTSPHVDAGILQLGLTGSARTCLDFYRQELKGHYETVKNGRGVAVVSAIGGLLVAGFSLRLPERLAPHFSAALTVGLVLAIGGGLRYLVLRREYPRVREEFENFQTCWPDTH